jgi:hypothetical protein
MNSQPSQFVVNYKGKKIGVLFSGMDFLTTAGAVIDLREMIGPAA